MLFTATDGVALAIKTMHPSLQQVRWCPGNEQAIRTAISNHQAAAKGKAHRKHWYASPLLQPQL